MTADREARVRERAYHLWLEEGQPHGRHDEHWHRAERELTEAEEGLGEDPPVATARAGAGPSGAPGPEPAGASRPRGNSPVPDRPQAEPRGGRVRSTGAGSPTARGGRRPAAKPAR